MPGIREFFLEAVFALDHVLKPGEPSFRVGGLNAVQGGEDVPAGFVGQVGVGLAGFCVLFRVEPAMFAADPGAVGFGTARSPGPFGISRFVLFPGGPQSRGGLSPRGAVGCDPEDGVRCSRYRISTVSRYRTWAATCSSGLMAASGLPRGSREAPVSAL
jgi:hypothetical protein